MVAKCKSTFWSQLIAFYFERDS